MCTTNVHVLTAALCTAVPMPVHTKPMAMATHWGTCVCGVAPLQSSGGRARRSRRLSGDVHHQSAAAAAWPRSAGADAMHPRCHAVYSMLAHLLAPTDAEPLWLVAGETFRSSQVEAAGCGCFGASAELHQSTTEWGDAERRRNVGTASRAFAAKFGFAHPECMPATVAEGMCTGNDNKDARKEYVPRAPS